MHRSILILELEHPADLSIYQRAIDVAFPPGRFSVHLAATEAEALAQAAPCTALVAKAHCVTKRLVDAMPQLDWIQSLTTGTDNLDRIGVPPSVRITSTRGMHAPQMSELAILLMLALNRDFPTLLKNQSTATWQRHPQKLLTGKTLVIVGIGVISEALAARARIFGMNVLGVSSRAGAVEGFGHVHPYGEIAQAAAAADFLVVVAPYSPATHHVVNKTVLAAMKPTAFLINIARGNVVQEDALIDALRENRLAGAGLDVFATEPLPPTSPFWTLANVIVTPHIGGMSDSYAEQATQILIDNLRAYEAGLPMRNLVR